MPMQPVRPPRDQPEIVRHPADQSHRTQAREFLRDAGITAAAEHVRAAGHCNIVRDLRSGHIWVKHVRTPIVYEV
jgi:hypothetical protein